MAASTKLFADGSRPSAVCGVSDRKLSTIQLALRIPPETNPRARTVELMGGVAAEICQPPAVRIPPPRLAQSTPLVDASNVVRQTSGLVPARSQLTLPPSNKRLWLAGSVLFNRPI